MAVKPYGIPCIIILFLLSCQDKTLQIYDYQKTAFSDHGMVVSAHPLATQAGVDVLRNGGNAIDAAITVAFTLAVVHPRAGNIGGGGFLVYRGADGKAAALDFREKAPAKAHRDMYLDTDGDIIPGLSTRGHLAAGVPGSVDGLYTAHSRFGSLPWQTLLEPAIKLAEDGHAITHDEAARLNRYREDMIPVNDEEIPFVKEEDWQGGDVIYQIDLANTLKRIALRGRDGFYSGETAALIIAEMAEGNGLITSGDLAHYASKWRGPVIASYKEYKLISMPPPSSGGVAIAQLLQMVEPYPLDAWGFQDVRSIHLMVEAERRVYADRAKYLGDIDFFPVPIDTLIDRTYLEMRMQDFRPDSATRSQAILAGDFQMQMERFETTHISIVDAEGNAVSLTTTLNSNYGCKVFVDGAGFFLNNEMDDFSAKPGVPNQFGLIGADANAIAPGKRMLSSMTPTILEKDGHLHMVLGTPGGSTIMTTVFQVILNVVEWKMTMTEAVDKTRFHHQWLPDEIKYEKDGLEKGTMQVLSKMGHTFREVHFIGVVNAILVQPSGRLEGAADKRATCHAEGI